MLGSSSKTLQAIPQGIIGAGGRIKCGHRTVKTPNCLAWQMNELVKQHAYICIHLHT